jgi:hypothetical protein
VGLVPRLTDPDRLAAYQDAIRNWHVTDYVRFKLSRESFRWARRELGVTEREIGRLMHEYVSAGGEIDEVRESRDFEYEFHYDLRFTINDKPVYIETRLDYRPPFVPDQSWILVVSIHAP